MLVIPAPCSPTSMSARPYAWIWHARQSFCSALPLLMVVTPRRAKTSAKLRSKSCSVCDGHSRQAWHCCRIF
jgi:hypothetical protein